MSANRTPAQTVTLTLRFDSADDRDEFLAEHIDRPCSDIMATVHLAERDPRHDHHPEM